MSALLWKTYFENDVDQFRHILANASFTSSAAHFKGTSSGFGGVYGSSAGSPGTGLATSPTLSHKNKRIGNWGFPGSTPTKSSKLAHSLTISRADINIKDSSGCTLLHHVASSGSENAVHFAAVLLDVPLLDLYAQDAESGWTALHRALYFGNVAVARLLLERDTRDAIGQSNVGGNHHACGLIKIKDHEGNSSFDVYGASIASRNLQKGPRVPLLPGLEADEDDVQVSSTSNERSDEDLLGQIVHPSIHVDGDELFTFGSNKNFTLGFGDEDDRQFPERIFVKRSDRLLRRLAREHGNPTDPATSASPTDGINDAFSAVVRYSRIIIQDVRLAKMHSAIVTKDPEANLYVCGFGPGGRLGTGDETTRFTFVPLCTGALANRRVVDIGLGQNHSVAITSKGEVFSWGNNEFGQLGLASASGISDEEPVQLLPKQVYGPLKREYVHGVAASRIHTVVHTSSSLYTFGKNDGQLGLVDSDARSLATQTIPRRVAAALFSSSIGTVSAIDKATVCLLENHDVWVFANYGYTKVAFPLDSSQDLIKNHFLATRYSMVPNHICKITSGNDTICAMSNEGDVFTVNVSHKTEGSLSQGSTTNPVKIRGALSAPQRIWTRKKGHMAVRDVDVGQDGSIIICTEDGSVWRRVRRAKVKVANAPLTTEYKPKDYKFSRIPGLTRIKAVRSNTSGAYAAIRGDCDVMQSQVTVDHHTLWKDFHPLLPFNDFSLAEENSDTENPRPRFWTPSFPASDNSSILQAVYYTKDVAQSIANLLTREGHTESPTYDMRVGSTISDVRLPIHEFMLSARSPTLKRALATFRRDYFFAMPKLLTIEYDKNGNTLLLFQDVDFLTVFNFVLYTYTDVVAEVWLQTRNPPHVVSRYRQVRNELMQIAAHLEMRSLEQSVRTQTLTPKTLHEDMNGAIRAPDYFESGDVNIQLDGSNLRAHSPVLCQRCPFFEGLFQGRAAGRWLSSRRQQSQELIDVDLKHVHPRVFELVRRYIYADSGEEIFDDVRCPDLDTFLDFVLEVMAVANELMLDRLSQCCQKLLAQYVDMRNVCQLLNAVSPCSVTEFKDAALEYICMNLEGMLENNLLKDLDQDLMLELDNTVRQNQLALQPISRSGRAEAELLETYPQLAEMIERDSRTRIDRIAFQSRHNVLTKSLASQAAFTDDDERPNKSPSMQALARKVSQGHGSEGQTPWMNTKQSTTDLMFDMDLGEETAVGRPSDQMSRHAPEDSPTISARQRESSRIPESPWLDAKGKEIDTNVSVSTSPFVLGEAASLQSTSPGRISSSNVRRPDEPPAWGRLATDPQKLDMKDIMAQASVNRVSNISAGLSAPTRQITPTSSSTPTRMTQKERKKQQQQGNLSQTRDVPPPQLTNPQAEYSPQASPWQVASRGAKTSLKDILDTKSEDPSASRNMSDKAVFNPPLTLRQTIPGKLSTAKRTTSEGASTTQPLRPQRSISTPTASASTPPRPSSSRHNTTSSPLAIGPSSTPPVTRSIHHSAPSQLASAEPSLQLSMADILSQQQTEKDVFKEAVAKRSLQEIQEEQAFQEWWDEESRKVRDEEEAASKAAASGRSR
ncbi:MAG: hypothetical protein Q9218_005867, partial [Villophora microphyllina]